MSQALALLQDVPALSDGAGPGPMLGLAVQLLAAGNEARRNPRHADAILAAAISIIETVRTDLATPAAAQRVARQAREPKAKKNAAPKREPRQVTAAPASAREVYVAPKPAPVTTSRAAVAGGGRTVAIDPLESAVWNDVKITFAADGCSVAHEGYRDAVDLSVKQARLISCLARAMPQPVDRKFIAGKVWASERAPAEFSNIISSMIRDIIEPLAGIGLTLKTVHGVGLSLQKAEGE